MKDTTITIRIDPRLKEWLKRKARELGRTLSDYIHLILEREAK